MDFEDIFEAAGQVFPFLVDDDEDQIYSILQQGKNYPNSFEFSQADF